MGTLEGSDAIAKTRKEFASDLDRLTIIAEAKLLVNQLDQYLEIIGEWATEEDGSATE